MALDSLEHRLTSLEKSTTIKDCWYRNLRTCKNQHSFDSSDHIVLFISQYIVPICVEAVVLQLYMRRYERKQRYKALGGKSSMSDFNENITNLVSLEPGTLSSTSAIPRLGYHKSHDGADVSEDEDNIALTSINSNNSSNSGTIALTMDPTECTNILPEEDISEGGVGGVHKPSYFYFKCYATVTICICLYILSLRGIVYTSSYFHTMTESIAGLIQCILLLILPLYALSHYNSYLFYYYVLGVHANKI